MKQRHKSTGMTAYRFEAVSDNLFICDEMLCTDQCRSSCWKEVQRRECGQLRSLPGLSSWRCPTGRYVVHSQHIVVEMASKNMAKRIQFIKKCDINSLDMIRQLKIQVSIRKISLKVLLLSTFYVYNTINNTIK